MRHRSDCRGAIEITAVFVFENCIAAIGLNVYGQERTRHDLIILSLPARLYASKLVGSCCVIHIAVLHLTMDGCNSHVYCTYYSYNDDWLWLSVSNLMSYVSIKVQ